MSGGFFRGTSADQDTRFSNKQAKLLKSQKFAPELETLVDMTRVKMDVMRPWIAKRVTELIGFEDEVLINFIYGLLEGKAVNGKQVQISLTGFMERNTGKFMKELWALLLSAQQNVSGVPQQFLDAKEEETKKRLVETDRIANEIRRKKDKELQEAEQEKPEMEGDKKTEVVSNSAHDAGMQPEDKRDKLRGRSDRMRSRVSGNSDSPNHSPSPRRKRSASPSKSPSSDGKSRSRSRGRSSRSPPVSFHGQRRSSPRRSLSPYRKHPYRRSPSPRHISSYSRRSQYKDYSPRHRRSRSPVRYRSRSPSYHRSRRSSRRSPANYRYREPVRHRSRSPARRRSLSASPRRRSPDFRSRKPESPENDHSLSPVHHLPPSHRSNPSPGRKRYQDSSVSPLRRSESPAQHRSPYHRKFNTPGHERSLSPKDSPSPKSTISGREKASEALHDKEDHVEHQKRQSSSSKSTVKEKQRNTDSSEQNSGGKDDNGRSDSELEPEAKDSAPPAKSKQREKNGLQRLPSEETDEYRDKGSEKRKHKKSGKNSDESDDESTYDSYEERKEAKRRRKERRRLKQEDRHRRREEKHLAREEKHAEKRKLKSPDHSDGGVRQQDSNPMDSSETEAEQRKLEIELREKAIESLRAKKGLGN